MLRERFLVRLVTGGLFLVLFTPLFFYQSAIDPFIIPKIFVFQALVAVVAALWAVLALNYPAYRPKRTAVAMALGVFLLVLAVSAIFGVDPARSVWSTQERGLGIFALVHFAVYFLVLSNMRSKISWRAYFSTSLLVSVIAGAFAFIQLTHPSLFFAGALWGPRPGSFFGNPTFLAAYLLFHIFLALSLGAERFVAADRERRRALYWYGAIYIVAAIFECVVIFLTQTRGAILGLGFGFLVLLVYAAFRGGSTRLTTGGSVRLFGRATLRSIAAALLLAGVAGVFIFWFTRQAAVWQKVPGVSRLTNIDQVISEIGPRLVALRISADAFRERPLLGFGFENFKYAFDARFEPTLLRYGYAETYFDKPHNVLAEYFVTAGVFGALAFAAFLGSIIWGLFRHPKNKFFLPFGLAIVFSYLAQDFFVFDTFGSYLMLFAVAACVDSADPRHDAAENLGNGPATAGAFRLIGAPLIAGICALILVGANASVIYANNRQYWILNYFLNRRSDLALVSFKSAIAAPVRPYATDARRDFASSLSQIYLQNLPIPDLVQTITLAMTELDKAIKAKPRDYYLRLTYADIATVFATTDPGYLVPAETHLREAMRLSPRRQQNYFVLAKIRMLQGKFGEALEYVRQAIDLDPQVGDSHFYYALIAFEAGDDKAGLPELDAAKQLGRVPLTAPEARIVANHYGDAGRYDEAIHWYLFDIERDPDDLEGILKLGLVYYYVGKNDDARKYIQEVADRTNLTQAPSYPLLKPILDELGIRLP